jgi:hypothetical protein
MDQGKHGVVTADTRSKLASLDPLALSRCVLRKKKRRALVAKTESAPEGYEMSTPIITRTKALALVPTLEPHDQPLSDLLTCFRERLHMPDTGAVEIALGVNAG